MASQSSQAPYVEEVIDAIEDHDRSLEGEQSDDGSDSDDRDDLDGQAGESSAGPSTSQSKKKKKKGKKNKALRLLKSLKPGEQKIPQALVDHVIEAVRKEHGENAAGADEENVRAALEQLKVMDVINGKAGIAGRGKKDLGQHKFWATQPVPQLGEGPPLDDGYIEPAVPTEQVRQDPYPLPKDFEWSTIDLTDPNQTREVYELLSQNYVEDDHASFRFHYTAEFLHWALTPPGYHQEWHIGVRVSSNKKLVAFISGVPFALRVRTNTFQASEINYLCVHKKLRSKRLAPVLIKEVTRRCHLKGIFQAIYTAGVLLPTPVSTCRYYHRLLKVPKLVDVEFTYVARNTTVARMIRLMKLAPAPKLADGEGLREMEERDLPEVGELYNRYMERFSMAPVMTLTEMRHQFLSGLGEADTMSDGWKGRKEKQVVWAYVVENPETHKITDFFTFYSLPSTVMKSVKYNLLEAAYLFYYATDVAFQPDAEERGLLKRRLTELIGDALIVADQAGFDVFNALTMMDNVEFLQDLKFGSGDGLLNYYLYNWRTTPIAGVNPTPDVKAGKGVGVVML